VNDDAKQQLARPAWTFPTHHGHVLLAVAADPVAKVAELAAAVARPRGAACILAAAGAKTEVPALAQ